MITAEAIYEKAKDLDSATLQEAYDFLDFLTYKRKSDWQRVLEEKNQFFPETELETPNQKPVYTTRTLSLEEMDAAIEYEAGLHK